MTKEQINKHIHICEVHLKANLKSKPKTESGQENRRIAIDYYQGRIDMWKNELRFAK